MCVQKPNIARRFFSGFDLAHDTYNAISCASDGKIYYVLCSEDIEIGGKMCSYDPTTDRIKILGDLNDICGQSGSRKITQGKSHVEFYENNGKLYFGTHVGHYEMIKGMERLPVQPIREFGLYPGGHFLTYDLITEKFADLGMISPGEGILTMTMDRDRARLYAISWPNGHFIRLDIKTGSIKNLGPISLKGEAGDLGSDYRVLCRSMFVFPEIGTVYFTNAEGDIFYYHPDEDVITKLEDVHLRRDYFGTYDISSAGSMGYNWRKIHWHPEEKVAYGIHGNSGYLFRFDPKKKDLEIMDRLTSGPSRKTGMFDQFSYGYLGFYLDVKNNLIYYLTGGPIFENGKRIEGESSIPRGGSKGPENLHLVTYNLTTNRYCDHGPIYYPDGSRPFFVNSIALDKTGNIYTLARMDYQGNIIADLVKIESPVKQK
jgi:hypothetical protein